MIDIAPLILNAPIQAGILEGIHDTWQMITEATFWLAIVASLYQITLLMWTIFVFAYVFIIELPGMLATMLTGMLERVMMRIKAKQAGLEIPHGELDYYNLSKKNSFCGMVREIRILILNWFLLMQNGSAIIMFGFIMGSLFLITIYAITQGIATTGGATMLDYAFELMTNTPYAILLLMSFGVIYGCYTVVVMAWKLFEYNMLKNNLYTVNPFKEMVAVWRQGPELDKE